MRYEHKSLPMDELMVEQIWKDFYAENPDIKHALKSYRDAEQSIMEEIFGNSKDTKENIGEEIVNTSKDRLYKYWKEAGLPGTPTQALEAFISKNIFRYIKFEEYDVTKAPLDNSRASRNNMLMQLIQKRLTDPETATQRYTPGGFVNASNAAAKIKTLVFDKNITADNLDLDTLEDKIDSDKDPEPNYDPSDPLTIITYNQQNQVAGKLIGVFANQNANHAFASIMEEFSIKEPIAFGDHVSLGLSDLLHKDNYEEVDLNVAEFLAASVDAVKDPVLKYLNFNTITADAGALLARLGYSTFEIGLLFNQPIIKEICSYSQNNNVGIEEAISVVASTYKLTSNGPIDKYYVSSEQLARNIIKERDGEALASGSLHTSQAEVLKLFSSIIKTSQELGDFLASTKFTASNSVGSTFGDFYAQQSRVSAYLKSLSSKKGKDTESNLRMRLSGSRIAPVENTPYDLLFSDKEQYMEYFMDNPFAYEQTMYDQYRKVITVLNKYYPYNTNFYRSIRSIIAGFTKNGSLDAATINSIHNDALVYLLTKNEFSRFNPDYPVPLTSVTREWVKERGLLGEEVFEDESINTSYIGARDYYLKVFPRNLYATLSANPQLKDLAIFKYMQVEENENTGELEIILQDSTGLNTYKKDEIRDSWTELLHINKELAEDLFLYNFHKLGFNFAHNSFMDCVPAEVKLNTAVEAIVNEGGEIEYTSYGDFIEKVISGDATDSLNAEDFAIQYVLNHPDNKKLIYKPSESVLSEVMPLVKSDKGYLPSFTLSVDPNNKKLKNFILKTTEDKKTVFRPFINIDGYIYMAYSNTPGQNNISNGGSIEYIRVERLGDSKNKVFYNYNTKISTGKTAYQEGEQSSITDIEAIDVVTEKFNPPSATRSEESSMNEVSQQLKNSGITNHSLQYIRSIVAEAIMEDEELSRNEIIENIKEKLSKDKTGQTTLDENGEVVPMC